MSNTQTKQSTVRPSGKLYLNANQLNLVDAAETLVELETIGTGFGDGIENTTTHRITVDKAGFYDIKAQVAFDSVVALKNYLVSIKKNRATYLAKVYGHSGLADDLMIIATALVFLAAGDYIELYAISYAGANTVDILAAQSHTFLSVQRVR